MMDSSTYVVIVIGAFVIIGFTASALKLLAPHKTRINIWLLKHIKYPLLPSFQPSILPKFLHISPRLSRFDGVLAFTMVLGNALACTIGVTSLDDFKRRLGRIAIANLIYLCLGSRVSLVSIGYGLSMAQYANIHASVGYLTVAEAIAHSALSASAIHLHAISGMAGLIVRALKCMC